MKIGIVGMGLIGGSLGRAILKYTDNTVLGSDTDEGALLKAEMLCAESAPMTDKDIGSLDMLIVALCPEATVKVLRETAPKLPSGAIIMDTCGVKRGIVDEMTRLSEEFPHLFFVGAHPMAGREFSGIAHSQATLFEKAYVIVVPVSQDLPRLAIVKKLFKDIGAQDVEICSAERHDQMISYTSQLAHIVSSSYVKNQRSSAHAGFSAGSFKDLTRVAKLNPDMWTELFLANGDNLLTDIDELLTHIEEYREAIAACDGAKLRGLLAEGVKMKEIAESARKEKMK